MYRLIVEKGVEGTRFHAVAETGIRFKEIAEKIDLHKRLEGRRVVAPEVYDEMCNLREKAHLKKDYKPQGNVETLVPNTYYLTEVDDMFRRKYAIAQ